MTQLNGPPIALHFLFLFSCPMSPSGFPTLLPIATAKQEDPDQGKKYVSMSSLYGIFPALKFPQIGGRKKYKRSQSLRGKRVAAQEESAGTTW